MNKTFAAIAAISVALLAGGCTSSPNQTEQNEAAMIDACKDRILNELKSPGSAEFGEMKLESINEKITMNSGNGPEVTLTHHTESWVDSQNSFGALIRNTFKCDMFIQDDGTAYATWGGLKEKS